jgi:hypothetical protein
MTDKKNTIPLNVEYLVFPLADDDEEAARRRYAERVGGEPEEVYNDGTYLWLGPVEKDV